MDIERFVKQSPRSDVAISEEDPTMFLIGTQSPNDVRLPPELGGHIVRVLKTEQANCPFNCGQLHITHRLENGMSVAECTCKNQFAWYKPKETTTP